MSGPILAVQGWKDNGAMIADVARLGYIKESDYVLDCTYGLGRFWTEWKPPRLVGTDINPERSLNAMAGVDRAGIDFRRLPFKDATFDVVVLDPPYRLNGTPDQDFDEQYGAEEVTRWQDRMKLVKDGITETMRVTRPNGYLLVKCQDQVCSGQVRWQTVEFANWASRKGGALVDQLHILGGGMPQPERTRKDGTPVKQKHAARAFSTLLIIQKRRR